MAPQTLQEVAQAHARATAELQEAQAEAMRLREPYEAAANRAHAIRREVERLELAMTTAKRMHFIQQAMIEARIDTNDPPVLVVPAGRHSDPRVYELVALASDGTGLYLYTPKRSHRYEGKTYAVRAERVTEEQRNERVTSSTARQHVNWTTKDEAEIGLLRWEERGRGDFGAGSGAVKPLGPPDGGRWKWLKVRKQSDLPVGQA